MNRPLDMDTTVMYQVWKECRKHVDTSVHLAIHSDIDFALTDYVDESMDWGVEFAVGKEIGLWMQ